MPARHPLITALTCLVLALTACTSGREGLPPGATPLGCPLRLPTPAELMTHHAAEAMRSSSSCESVAHSAAAFDLSLPLRNVAPSLGGAAFAPDTQAGAEFGTMAFALYSINALSYSGPSELHTYWNTLTVDKLWLGVANFATDRWDWFHPDSPNLPDFGALADHRNAVGTMVLAVALVGSAPGELHLLRLGPPDLCGELLVTPQASIAPTTKQFDISGLYVTGDSILACDWDFESDGILDDTGLGVHSHLYSSPGDYTLTLTVQTALQDQIELALPLIVLSGSWEAQAIAGPLPQFHFSSPRLGLVGGVPALAYIARFDGDPPDIPAYQRVEILLADDRLAHSWHYACAPLSQSEHTRVYSVVDSGGMPLLLAANLLLGSESPQVIYPLDNSYFNWGALTFADPLAGSARDADLAEVNGAYCLAFRDSTDRLMVSHSNGADAGDWTGADDTTWGCNGNLALAAVNGYPAIACERFSGVQQVAYLLSSSPSGEAGTWNPHFSDALYTSTPALAWVDGHPVMTAGAGLDFQYSAGDAPAGENNWHFGQPSNGGGLGEWCSIGGACLDGAVFVASKSSTAAMGYTLVYDNGSVISGDNDIVESQFGVDLGTNCDALCVDGVPMVAYEDSSSLALRIAVMR